MSLKAFALVLPLFLLVAAAPQATAQPVNDECVGAIVIVDGLNAPSNNLTATTSNPPWTCGAGLNDVWFSYVATCNGVATFSLCTSGGTANFDTAMEAFAGTCATLSLLNCNDNACGNPSQLVVPVVSGAPYLVRVGGFDGEVGNFTMFVSCAPAALPNDECAGAISIVDGLNPIATNVGSTLSAPTWGCSIGGTDVWFSYTAGCSQNTTFTLCSGGFANFDSILSVYDGSCATPVLLGCDDDTCALASEVTTPVTAGNTYLVRVGGFNGNSGNFQLYVHHGGAYNFVATGCGPLTLTPFNQPDMGQTVSFVLGGFSGTPAMWLGFPTNVPLCTTPIACSLGATLDAFFVPLSTFQATIPCDPSLSGASVAIQGGDLFVPGGCVSPISFAVSNTVVATIG